MTAPKCGTIRKTNGLSAEYIISALGASRLRISANHKRARKRARSGGPPWEQISALPAWIGSSGSTGTGYAISHRARTHDNEKVWPWRHAVHVRLNLRYITEHATPAGTLSSPACATHAVRRRSPDCSSRATSDSRSSGTRRGSPRRTSAIRSPGSRARPDPPRLSK